MECLCDWCRTRKKTHDDFLKYEEDIYLTSIYREQIMFTIAKYGEEYFDKFDKKWSEYYKSILDDAPYSFSIFDNDIAKGCFIINILHKRIKSITRYFELTIVKYKLSIPTIKHILENCNYVSHHISLDYTLLFEKCVSLNCIQYFKTIATGLMASYKIMDKKFFRYADYLLMLNTGNQLNPEIYEVLVSILGVDRVYSDIIHARNHGKFKKTDVVFYNYKKIIEIIDNMP